MPISIERNKRTKQFFARITGKNGEIIYSGETVTRKANAVRQLISLAKQLNSVRFTVVDNTLEEPKETTYDMGRDLIKDAQADIWS